MKATREDTGSAYSHKAALSPPASRPSSSSIPDSSTLSQPLLSHFSDSPLGSNEGNTTNSTHAGLASSIWPLLLPSTFFFITLFGIQPILSQFLIQVRGQIFQ